MSTILCKTCLSSERHLIQLQYFPFYTNLWHSVSLQMTDYICWECKAMFNNIWRFKQQVLTAQDVLRNQNLTEIPKVNQCLSKLTKSIKTSYDSEYYEDDVIKTEPPSVDYLDETVLHEEVHLTDDCSRTEPMKTEIEDTELNISNDEGEIEISSDVEENGTNETLPFDYQPSAKEKLFIIKIMTEDQLLKARERERGLSSYTIFPHKCEKCIIGYYNKGFYERHLKEIHDAKMGEFFCKVCEVRFPDLVSCTAHTMRHYIRYQCRLCEYTSHRIDSMVVHDRDVHADRIRKCAICPAEFPNKKLLKHHHLKEHGERPICSICKKQYSSRGILKRHIMLIHKGLQPIVKCEICKKQYKNVKIHMLTHQRVVADENAFCAECNKQYGSVAKYRQHLSQNKKHADPNKFSFECTECGKRFFTNNNLVRHMNAIHYNKKDHVCRICAKGFIRPDQLKQHTLYTHEGVSRPRKYICGICDKGFTMRQVLVNHIRTHTGERPFECDLCDAKFAQKTALKTHVKGVHKKLYRKCAD